MSRTEVIGYQQDGPMDQWGAKLQTQSAGATPEQGAAPLVGTGGPSSPARALATRNDKLGAILHGQENGKESADDRIGRNDSVKNQNETGGGQLPDELKRKVIGCGDGFGPSPLAVRLSFEANRGTPALASMIARVLLEAGATVTFGNNAAEMPERPCNLLGLHVHIDRLTWVRDEESERWTDRPNKANEPTTGS